MLHLRREQYRSMPWRNGMGVTLEIAREPRTGDDFQWRLSLATVASSGPFSNYAGYRRSVTLIEGDGFQLGIGGQDPVVLDWLGATALFPGDAPTHGTLLNGPATDLSLMVREPGTIISVTRIQGVETFTVPLETGALKAVFCLREGTRLIPTDEPMAGSPTRAQLELALHDTVLLSEQVTTLSLAPPAGISADLLLLTWHAAGTGRS
jgi:environmental stress-induced protein Ves